MKLVPRQAIGGRVWPMTVSGYGLIVRMTDQDAFDVRSGDIVIVESPTGLKPLAVHEVRYGVAEDLAGMPYEVLVFDGTIYGGSPLTYAIPDCFRIEIIQL